MFPCRRVLQRWFLALVLLCSPVPHHGRPLDALSSRTKRSVTHTQLMHDKSRTLQDFRRRMWLQELLDVVHTAEIRDLAVRTTGTSVGPGINPSTTGSTLHSKPPGGTKDLPTGFHQDEEESLTQDTNKSQAYKVPGKRRKKGKSGRRKEGDKRRRRARSLARERKH